MRSKTARRLLKLVIKKDERILDSITRNVRDVKEMSGEAIYRNAKKLWTRGIGKKENWLCNK